MNARTRCNFFDHNRVVRGSRVVVSQDFRLAGFQPGTGWPAKSDKQDEDRFTAGFYFDGSAIPESDKECQSSPRKGGYKKALGMVGSIIF
jgi:hypothetical protein